MFQTQIHKDFQIGMMGLYEFRRLVVCKSFVRPREYNFFSFIHNSVSAIDKIINMVANVQNATIVKKFVRNG